MFGALDNRSALRAFRVRSQWRSMFGVFKAAPMAIDVRRDPFCCS
jgi:hypothetical protein